MKPVITQFIDDMQQDENKSGKANGQTQYVDNGITLLP
jgi:hypothetical protein